jgi:hypothetical protein
MRRARSLALSLATLAALASPLALVGCDRRPDWAKPAPGGTTGETTIAGEPLSIPYFATPPVLDGKLDDAAWASAARTGMFVNPGNGASIETAQVSGFARLGWDDKKLYVGVVVFDEAPTTPFGRDAVDPHLWEHSSAVELMIQPGDPGDNREYYELQVDPGGAVFDTRWDDYNRPIVGGPDEASKRFGHMDWSSAMERAAHLAKTFYSLEFAVPWSSFASNRTPPISIPPKPGDVWRLNLYTFRDGQRQALAWSPIMGKGNFHKSAQWGRVKFAK